MATTLFLLSTGADTHLGTDELDLTGNARSWDSFALSTSRGSGVLNSPSTATVTGATAGIEIRTSATTELYNWISPPLSADVTISGTITINIWGQESNMSANVAINAVVEVIRANTTTTRNSNTLVEIARSTRVTELAFGGVNALNNFTVTPTSTVVNRGDRLRIRIFGDDAGTMATGFFFNIGYNGTTAAVDGDTFLTFTENFSFESAPSGTQLFLTNVQSGLTGAPALISDFTGADENPLSEGGNWAALNTSTNPLRRVSNTVTVTANLANSGSYWTPANFGPDLEAYVTVTTMGAASQVGIAVRVQGEGGANTWDGYTLTAHSGSLFILQRYDNGVAAATLKDAGVSIASGDKIGIRIEGSTIQGWRLPSGSSDWRLLVTAVDTTYPSAGKVGLIVQNTANFLDDFYAATDSNLFTQQAWTSRGAGVVSYVSDTNAGWTAPLLTAEWFTPGLNAFTLTGMAQANIRALESNASANASLRCEVARVESDGTSPTVWATWCQDAGSGAGGELPTAEAAQTINVSGDDLAISDGQRLRIRLYLEDAGFAAMGNAFNVQPFYNGTSAAASGDSYVTLAQSVTEFVASAASDPTSWINERRTPRRRSMQRW